MYNGFSPFSITHGNDMHLWSWFDLDAMIPAGLHIHLSHFRTNLAVLYSEMVSFHTFQWRSQSLLDLENNVSLFLVYGLDMNYTGGIHSANFHTCTSEAVVVATLNMQDGRRTYVGGQEVVNLSQVKRVLTSFILWLYL